MPRWSEQNLRDYERRNKTRGALPGTQSKQAVCHEPVAAKEGKAKDSTRYAVRVKSFRVRLLDPDNLCPKFFIDSLRYAGAIQNDRPQDIELHVSQEKVNSEDLERTEIEITPI